MGSVAFLAETYLTDVVQPTDISDSKELPVADFSGDTIGIVIGKVLAIFVLLMLTTLFTIWAERRVVARMQSRPGPNRTGPFGLLQSLADGVKLMLKEDLTPRGVDVVVFVAAPIISAVTAFLAFAVIPLGPQARIPFTDISTPLQLTDFSVAILYILAVASVGVYGIVLAGWASGSTYPLLGGIRSSAQVISYEIAMGLALISVFLYAGSASTSRIVAAQNEPMWFAVALLPSFVIYVIAMVGETNRAPFDLPEAEGELVGGFHTEYSSLKFAMFFLAEYINMVTVSAVATTVFLGGWRAPWPLSTINGGALNQGWWPVLWFVAKLFGFLFLFIWLRGTLPRLRYDQFMNFGWKVLIPLGLVWITIVMVLRAMNSGELTDGQRIMAMALVTVVTVALVAAVWRHLSAQIVKDDARHQQPAAEIDPFAGGFPVPALPGQQLREPVASASITTSGPIPPLFAEGMRADD